MSYHLSSPVRIIPRVHLSPKIKQKTQSPRPSGIKKRGRKSPKKLVSPKRITSPYQKSRSKVFLAQRESFRKNPTINPVSNRQIKVNGDVYKKLVKLYGKPY